jgi:hypothetical protein
MICFLKNEKIAISNSPTNKTIKTVESAEDVNNNLVSIFSPAGMLNTK